MKFLTSLEKWQDSLSKQALDVFEACLAFHFPFSGCSSLNSIEILSSVTSIGFYGSDVFENCSSLTKTTNHSSVNFALDSSIHEGENGQ